MSGPCVSHARCYTAGELLLSPWGIMAWGSTSREPPGFSRGEMSLKRLRARSASMCRAGIFLLINCAHMPLVCLVIQAGKYIVP